MSWVNRQQHARKDVLERGKNGDGDQKRARKHEKKGRKVKKKTFTRFKKKLTHGIRDKQGGGGTSS